MIVPAKAIIPALLLIALVGPVLGGGALSLATDVGLTDEQVCDALTAHGERAVHRLEASGFPHATPRPVEVYRLSVEGTPKAVVQIDWASSQAECLPLEYGGRVSANADMEPGAYRALVGNLQSVIATGELHGSPGNFLSLWWGTTLTVEGDETEGREYRWQLAKWSAGWLAENTQEAT